jgi:hypothetical protein
MPTKTNFLGLKNIYICTLVVICVSKLKSCLTIEPLLNTSYILMYWQLLRAYIKREGSVHRPGLLRRRGRPGRGYGGQACQRHIARF